MKSTDFVTALAALLSQPELQTCFASDPNRVADQLNLIGNDRAMFIALSPAQVCAQANLLITKRMKEVHKFLPYTFRILGKDVETFFKSYAVTYWPHTHRRHFDDADLFCHYLIVNKYPVNQSELNRLRFLKSGRRFSFCLAKDVWIKDRHFWAIQMFYKRNGTEGQWRMYLKG